MAEPGSPEPVTVIGSITITKRFDADGRVVVAVEYDGLGAYEAIGLLVAELDTQRAAVQQSRS